MGKTIIMGEMLLQKYEVIALLGRGTQGEVFLVRDSNLDRLAAVKVCYVR